MPQLTQPKKPAVPSIIILRYPHPADASFQRFFFSDRLPIAPVYSIIFLVVREALLHNLQFL